MSSFVGPGTICAGVDEQLAGSVDGINGLLGNQLAGEAQASAQRLGKRG